MRQFIKFFKTENMYRRKGRSVATRVGTLEGVAAQTVLCSSETLGLNARERRKVEVFDMK